MNGAGASAMACTNLLLNQVLKNQILTMVDSKGVINKKRKDLNKWKLFYASNTNAKNLNDAIKNADVF